MSLKKYLESLPDEYRQGRLYDDVIQEHNLGLKSTGYRKESKELLYYLFPRITKKDINDIFKDDFTEVYEELKKRPSSTRNRQVSKPEIKNRHLLDEIRPLSIFDFEHQDSLDYFGLNRNFTFNELEKAYRIKSKTEHTDRGGSDEKFIILQNHYEILKKFV